MRLEKTINFICVAIAMVILGFLMVGCVPAPVPIGTVPPVNDTIPNGNSFTPIQLDYVVASPKFIWKDELVKAIKEHGQQLTTALPKDIEDFCPGYANLGYERRVQFWVMLMSRLAYHESKYNSSTTFEEPNVISGGKRQISRGLFQISLISSTNYFCGFQNAEEIHDPVKNIICAVKAFNILVPAGDKFNSPSKGADEGSYVGKRDGIWRGAAKYWSPFRRPSQRADMASYTRKVCP